MDIIIITDPNLGWDCIKGVFSSLKLAYTHCFNDDGVVSESEIHKKFDEKDWVIHEETVQVSNLREPKY